MRISILWIDAAFAIGAAFLAVLAIAAITVHAWGWSASDVAAWVQAVGSIGAILGAIWIAGGQHRRDLERRKAEQAKADYLVGAELAWVSGDVVAFLNEFVYIKPKLAPQHALNGDDMADLLQRLTWCRQRAEHKGQLAMVGALRNSLVRTVEIVQARQIQVGIEFTREEVKRLGEYRDRACEVFNAANGVGTIPAQYSR